jgi:hypothetical protein
MYIYIYAKIWKAWDLNRGKLLISFDFNQQEKRRNEDLTHKHVDRIAICPAGILVKGARKILGSSRDFD